MKRREFIAGLGSAAAWPVVARGQQPGGTRRIGVLLGGAEDDLITQSLIHAFEASLRNLGWVQGRNLLIEAFFTSGDARQMRAIVDGVLARNPDAIVSNNTPIVQELQRRTHTVPIVFVTLADPVDSGIVASLAHPGGNTTGFMNPEPGMSGKWLELLKEVAPNIRRVHVIVNAGNVGNAARLRVMQALAPSIGMHLSSSAIRGPGDIESAINGIAGEPNAGLIATPASPINELRKSIFALAERHRLPAIYAYRYYAADGGLMSYGAEPDRMWEQTATYIDRILRGARPGDLPVQGPSKFQLVINLKAAKAIGLAIPQKLLAITDELIE
jgi:putative ABC transport system substrate-binding protein